jgi:hypothetical protein
MAVIDLNEESLSGVELLALYGDDDDRLGNIFSAARNRLRKAARYAVRHSPQYAAAKFARKHIHGDEELGAFLPGLRKAARRVIKNSPQHLAYMAARRHLHGDEELGAFLPGLMKGVKSVGKFTSGITTGLARAVGVPQSALDALSHIDPTKKNKGSAMDIANASLVALQKQPGKTVVTVPKQVLGMSMKKVAIIGGASVGGVVVLGLLLRKRAKNRAE